MRYQIEIQITYKVQVEAGDICKAIDLAHERIDKDPGDYETKRETVDHCELEPDMEEDT